MKSITQSINTTRSNWRYYITSLILVGLAVYILHPFRSSAVEGLSGAEIPKIQKALDEYSASVETICKTGIQEISSLKNLSQVDSIALSPIVGSDTAGKTTNAYKIEQISNLNLKNEDVLKSLNTVQGQQYSAILKLLHAIPQDTTDQGFNTIIKQQNTTVKSILSGTTSIFTVINNYVAGSIEIA